MRINWASNAQSLLTLLLVFFCFLAFEAYLHRKQLSLLWLKARGGDFGIGIANRAVAIFWSALLFYGAALLVAGVDESGYPNKPMGFGLLGDLPFLAQAVAVFVIRDFLDYWLHRLFHLSFFWRFHRWHHEPREMRASLSLRFHPVEYLAIRVLTPSMLFLGFSFEAVLAFGLLQGAYSFWLHSGWPFLHGRGIVTTPGFHAVHHSQEKAAYDKNFATYLPLWDRIFGTYLDERLRPVSQPR